MYNDGSYETDFVMPITWFFPEKNLKNKDIVSPTQIFELLVWDPKVVKTCIIVKQSVISCL